LDILRKMWKRWKIIGAEVGNYQGRAIVLVFYYTVMVPFGAGVRLLSDPLRLKPNAAASAWREREPTNPDIEAARRQF
jgi:hypothetical protein